MPCVHGNGWVLTLGGNEYIIKRGNVSILFEWHPWFGPVPMNRRTGSDRQLGSRHWFWHAVTCWDKQGRKVENGEAIYGPPPTDKFYRVGRDLFRIDDNDFLDMARRRGITLEIVEIPQY
jgi:hypothetical protein